MSDAAATFGERIAERAGPLVVKEVLQGLRAKVFAISFGVLLAMCVTVALVAAADANEYFSDNIGRKYLAIYLGGLAAVNFFIIPYTAYRSMAREREEETWVLLVLTGLSARSIVRGKVTSALSQALLYGSACTPFVVFSYFLNGVDLITVVAALVLSFTWCVFLVAVAVSLACEVEDRLMRAGVHLLMVFGALGATGMGIGFGAVLAEEGGRAIHERAFWVFVAAFVVGGLTSALAVTEGAASRLGLATSRGGWGARLVVTGQVLLGVALTTAGALFTSADKEVTAVGSILSSLLLLAYGYLAISQPDGVARVHRTGFWMSTPGALRAFALTVMLLVGSTAAYVILYTVLPGSDWNGRTIRTVLSAPAYVLLYLSLGAALARATPLGRLGEPRATRVVVVMLVVLGVVGSVLGSLLFTRRENDVLWNALNPLVGLLNAIDRTDQGLRSPAFVLLMVATAAAVLMAWAALLAKDREPERG